MTIDMIMAMTIDHETDPILPDTSELFKILSKVFRNTFASLATASPASSQSSASENIQHPSHQNFQCIIFAASAKQDAKYLCGIQILIFNKEA